MSDQFVIGEYSLKYTPETLAPADAEARKAVEPVICYPIDTLPPHDKAFYGEARKQLVQIDEVIAPHSTRKRLARALEMLKTKEQTLPPKKHDNIPL